MELTVSDQIIKDDSRFIHGEDLQRGGKWSDITLTIKSVGDENSMKSKQGQVIEGYPVHFVETTKVAVLRKSNVRLLKAALKTNDREKMVGQKLTLYPVKGDWLGQKDVIAVRVRVPEGNAKPLIQKQHLGVDLTK